MGLMNLLLKTKEGDRYVGKWKNDKMNGQGKYFYTSASYPKLVGNFKKNKPNGVCTYYVSKNKKYKTTWKNGVCISITK